MYTNSASKAETNIIQLVTELINSFDNCTKQPYVRTQLAIATMNECRSYKLACTEQPYVRTQQEKVQHSYIQVDIIQIVTVLINSTAVHTYTANYSYTERTRYKHKRKD